MNAELDALAYNGSDLVVRCPIEDCDNPATRVTLDPGWQAAVHDGAAIPIVGCGNPWHYVEDIVQARPEGEVAVVLTVERVRAAVREIRAIDWTDKDDDLSRYAREVFLGLVLGPVPRA